jgi:hypothetical protein
LWELTHVWKIVFNRQSRQRDPERGALTVIEREVHFALEREAESDLNEFKWMRGANQRSIGLTWMCRLNCAQGKLPLLRSRSGSKRPVLAISLLGPHAYEPAQSFWRG